MLEAAVTERGGAVRLAKVDVDRNPGLAQRYGVQGIPQVLGFTDGEVRSQFTGAVPVARITAFLDELVPSAGDLAVALAGTQEAAAARDTLEAALTADPGHRPAAMALAELVLTDDPDRALELLHPHRPDPTVEALVTRAELARSGGSDLGVLRERAAAGDDDAALLELGRALAADGQHEEALERLLAAVRLGGELRDTARAQLVALFGVLGNDDPRVQAARPRLAQALH